MTSGILSAVWTLKSSLAYFIEPDFELLEHLLRLEVLDVRQLASVRRKETVFDRNDALLELLASEEQCVKFLHALQRAGQQHVVNFIKENGGQKHHDDMYILSIECSTCTKRQTVKSFTSCMSVSLFGSITCMLTIGKMQCLSIIQSAV